MILGHLEKSTKKLHFLYIKCYFKKVAQRFPLHPKKQLLSKRNRLHPGLEIGWGGGWDLSLFVLVLDLARHVSSSIYNTEHRSSHSIPLLCFPFLSIPFLSFTHFEKNGRSKEETSRHKQRHRHRSCAWRHWHSQVCSSRMHSYTQTYIHAYIHTYTYT